MKKMISAVTVTLLALCLLAGCAGQPKGPVTNAQVTIVAPDGAELVNETVQVQKENPTAEDAVLAACQDKKISYTLNNGMFDKFGGVASTQTDGWLFYYNGALAEVGSNIQKLDDGANVVFKYVNYDEAFGSAGQ